MMASFKRDLQLLFWIKKNFTLVFLLYSSVLKYSKKLRGQLLSSHVLWEDDILRGLSRCWWMEISSPAQVFSEPHPWSRAEGSATDLKQNMIVGKCLKITCAALQTSTETFSYEGICQ